MAKLQRKVGTTSEIVQVLLVNQTSSIGAGATGIAFGSVTAYYFRNTGTQSQKITTTLQNVLGTYVSGGWSEIDSTNMPGLYSFCLPNACFASGADNVVTTIITPTAITDSLEIELTATDNQTSLASQTIGQAGATATVGQLLNIFSLPTLTIGSVGFAANTSGTIDFVRNTLTVVSIQDKTGYAVASGTVDLARATFTTWNVLNTPPTTATLSPVTTIAQVLFTSTCGVVLSGLSVASTVTVISNLDKTGYTVSAGTIDLSRATFTTLNVVNSQSSSGSVTVVSNLDKTGYSLSQSFPANFSSLSINSAGRVKIQAGVTQSSAFTFDSLMLLNSGTVAAGVTCTSQYSLSGSAFQNSATQPVEISNGIFRITVAANECNASEMSIRITGANCQDQEFPINPVP